MEAWVLDGAFGLENLRRRAHPEPEPGPGEVRVRLSAASLNYRDLLMIRGQYDPRQPLPLVPCSDAVGRVEAVGPGVEGWTVGDRVCPIFAQGWHAGRPSRRMMRTTLGGPLDGTLRGAMVVPQAALVAVPDHLTDAEAATLPCAGVTAWQALVRQGGVVAGDTVLTLGTGGVSLFALQIATMLGARCVVTSSSDDKLARARAMGAVHGVNYVADPTWGRTVARWSGEGVDLVMELGGAGTLDQSLRAVRAGGTLALIGVLAGVTTEVALTRVLMHGVRIQGVYVGHKQDFEALNRALSAHPDVRPVVDRVFGFDEVPAAFAHLQAGAHMGKVVVDLSDAA